MISGLKGVKRILIINLAFIGDVLLSTPVARALRDAFPEAVIDMLVIPLAAPIARGNPYINNIIEYDKRGRHKKIGELIKLIRQLRTNRYDLAVTTNFAPRGTALAWVAGIRYRAGYDAQHAGWFLTHMASSHRPLVRHEAENYLDVLKPLGISTADTSLAFKVDPADTETMRQKVRYNPGKRLILICPVGSYSQKSWSADGFAELIRSFTPAAECYLIGAQKEEAELTAINATAGNLATVLAGTLSLGELAALITKADLLISVDTGPMHMADALGTPVLALFGPTDPCKWGPRGPRSVVLYSPADCSPCWGRTECPDHKCMSGLSVGQVRTAALALLERFADAKNRRSHTDI